jgi:hypothetical protein
MLKRIEFYSTTDLLTTMEDTNAFELNFPGVLANIARMFPNDVVDNYVISLEVRPNHFVQVCTVFLS